MKVHPHTRFELPDALNAGEPPEARGLSRDHVKLLVAENSAVTHTSFDRLGEHLGPGDLLLVNTSGTLAAAVDGSQYTVHFSTPLDDGTWVVELRNDGQPMFDGTPELRVELPEGVLTLLAPYRSSPNRLWIARPPVPDVLGYLQRYGRPITYNYVGKRWPLASYQTVFAREPGSAEMPSAARPFSFELVSRLASQGVLIAPIVLHCGVSSLESHEPPQPERYDVPIHTARLVNWIKSNGGRVIAVGTTAVRAIESAATGDTGGTGDTVRPAGGWTDLVLSPDHPPQIVDGLITGWHAPEASHLLLLESVAGAEQVQRAYDAAVQHNYLWHEFGDSCLLLR